MSAITYKPEAARKGHEQVVDQDYEQGADPDYDDFSQDGGSAGVDRDYDDDYRDPDSDDSGNQEYRKRSQK